MERIPAGLVVCLCCTFLTVGCARSVHVLAPPEGDPPPVQNNPITFTIELHPRADVSTFRATIDAPIVTGGGGTETDITSAFSPPPAAGGQSTAVITVPQTDCAYLLTGCIDERRLRVEARMSPRRAFDSIGHSHVFRLQGTSTPAPPPPPPAASFQLSVPNAEALVHWGGTASYVVDVSSQNGFTGAVTLQAQNLPFGISTSPVTVTVPASGSATATFTIAADHAAAELGQHSFTLQATGSGSPNRTRSLDLHVLPEEGSFGSLNWVSGPSSCGSIQAVVAGTVSFQSSGFNTSGLQFLSYAYTPDCRGAVVIGPSVGVNQGNTVNIFNFEFPDDIAEAPGSTRNLSAAPYDESEFLVSPDGSYLIAVSAGANSYHASLWHMLELFQINPPRPYSIAASLSAEVSGTEVAVTPTVGNAFSWRLP